MAKQQNEKSTQIHMYVYIHICIDAYMYVFMYVCGQTYIYVYTNIHILHTCMQNTCIYVCP